MDLGDTAGNIIKDQKKLSFDYVPKELPNRDEEIKNLFGLFRGVVKSDVSQNVFLHGQVGTGKTATAKRFCMDFKDWAQDKGKNIEYVFVNCRRRKNNLESGPTRPRFRSRRCKPCAASSILVS